MRPKHIACRDAELFHKLAGDYLLELGFELFNDPKKILSPYQKSHAIYRNRSGLFLLAGFEPLDGHIAGLYCGRRWEDNAGWYAFSNSYRELGKRLGFDLPGKYELSRNGSEPAIRTMVGDLKDTLLNVANRVTLADLVYVERKEFGARSIAELTHGADYLKHVKISGFQEAARS